MARSIRRAGLVLVLALLGVPATPAGVAAAGTGAGSGAAGPPCASPVLDRPLPGTRALSALGSSGLARAAGANSDRAGRLAARLAADRTLWLDRCGKQFYVDAAEPAPQAAVADVAAAAPFPYDQTFALHSRPDSLRTIYLDFGGATISGTAWNDTVASFPAPPYDTDG